MCAAYLAMLKRFEEVSALHQRTVASVSKPSWAGTEWVQDHVSARARH